MKPTPFWHLTRQVDKASRRYAQSLANGDVHRRGDGNVEAQAERYRDGCERAEYLSQLTRAVVFRYGVSTIEIIGYRSFALHIDKVCRKFAAEARRVMVEEALARWTLRGLDPVVLRAICKEAFQLTDDDMRPSV